MRFSIATVLAFATAAMAQVAGFHPITKPTEGEKVAAGSTYTIVWEPSAAPAHQGPVTIGLLGGSSPGTLAVIDTIADGVDGKKGSFSWQVGEDLGNLATYGIMISLKSDPTIFQYGFPFQIVGGSGSGSSSSGTATGSATETGTGTATTTGTSKSSTVTSTDSSTSTSTSFSVPSSTIASSTIRGNLTTTSRGSGGQTTITSVVIPTGPSTTTTSTTTIATNGVASVAAGSFALFGGVAMAVLAL